MRTAPGVQAVVVVLAAFARVTITGDRMRISMARSVVRSSGMRECNPGGPGKEIPAARESGGESTSIPA